MGDIADYYIDKMTGEIPKHLRKELNQMSYEKKSYTAQPGDVTLFAHEAGGNPKAPAHSGFVIAHRDIRAGEKLGISLWAGKEGSSKTFGGKVQDYYAKDPKKAALSKALDEAEAVAQRNKASRDTRYDKPPVEDFSDLPF